MKIYIKPAIQRKPERMKMSFPNFEALMEYAKTLKFLLDMRGGGS